MPFQIPAEYAPRIRSLLEFPDDRRQEFLKALADAGSFFNTNDLARDVSEKTKIPIPITDSMIQVLGRLYTIREGRGIPLEVFVDGEVREASEQILVPLPEKKDEKTADWVKRETEARWKKFRDIVITALSLDNTVGAAAKAGPVLTEHERILTDARVLTDVRLIFHPDLSEKPQSSVIVHMLRLSTRDIYGNKTAEYFALDSNDIRLLKQLMDRAIKKEETIKSLMANSGVGVIAPKEFF